MSELLHAASISAGPCDRTPFGCTERIAACQDRAAEARIGYVSTGWTLPCIITVMSFVLLVDDTRTFRDGREHVRARTSGEALVALGLVRDYGHGQLWLDHDLGIVDGSVDSTLPVLDELARAASDGDPYPFDLVVVHTSNPVGAATIMQVLERWGYVSRRVPNADELVDET